jgi:hypothetical protein
MPSTKTEYNVNWIGKIVVHEESTRVKFLWVWEDVIVMEYGTDRGIR